MTKPGYMEKLPAIARLFYGLSMAAIGIQQFIYPDFRPVVLPPGWPGWLHASPVWAYITGAAIIIAGIFIAINKQARNVSLALGGFLFFLFIVYQCSFVLFVQPHSPMHLGLWTDPLKELALAGGAFVIAGVSTPVNGKSKWITTLEKMIPIGRIFFSITMIAFGLDHFYYTDFVATLVPVWMPGPTFWTYFGGIALIGSGLGIALKLWIRPVALLCAAMLFAWFIVLHIPRAIADPTGNAGNEITSVLEALAFSGIALGIAWMYKNDNYLRSKK